MLFNVPVLLVAGLAITYIAATETAPCPLGTVAIDITSSSDVLDLTDVIDCMGGGVFNVTWYSSLIIEQTIEVSDHKNLTVTGIGFPTISAGLVDDDNTAIDVGGTTTGLFSVQNGSSLILKQLALEGGDAEDGSAVSVLSFSSLYVYDCGFTNNNASNGGAISASNSSEVYVDGTTWFHNNSAYLGGAIFASKSMITVGGNTSFHSNKAGIGGGIYADESVVNIKGITSFDRNTAQDALKTTNYPTSSGGIYAYTEPISSGGAIHVSSSEVYIEGDTVFSHSTGADYGGAMYAELSWVFMDGSTDFSNNNVDRYGGDRG